MNRRQYRGDHDVKLLQDFTAEAIAKTGGCGYLHPGDIPQHLFNGNKLYDPVEMTTIWEDDQGVAAWVLIGPRHKSYDAQVRPDLRGNDFERDVLAYADERLVEEVRRHNIDTSRIYADAYQCDTARAQLLKELGWELVDQSNYFINRAKLTEMDQPALPDGYKIRAARGIDEAAKLAEVHISAFGSVWTPELYQRFMEAPGYEPENEFIVEAPDGTFAAFTIIWYDHLNRTGYFEPVGTHKDHRRLGLGKAVVLYGMQQMVAAGMEYATVANFRDNVGAGKLYKSCGFKPWFELDEYSKPLSI